jgi:hypothetical protein
VKPLKPPGFLSVLLTVILTIAVYIVRVFIEQEA